jgi:hypothetical protein
MKRAVCIGGSLLALLTAAGVGRPVFVTLSAQAKASAPAMKVEPLWPKPFPQKKAWILSQVTGVTVDAQDHIWVVHRGVDSRRPTRRPRSAGQLVLLRRAADPRVRCRRHAPQQLGAEGHEGLRLAA